MVQAYTINYSLHVKLHLLACGVYGIPVHSTRLHLGNEKNLIFKFEKYNVSLPDLTLGTRTYPHILIIHNVFIIKR